MLKIMEYSHGDYEVTLMERMQKLTADEEAQLSLLARSFYNGIKYSFVSQSVMRTSVAANMDQALN